MKAASPAADQSAGRERAADDEQATGASSVTDSYPNDTDGDALRRVVSSGSDMSKSMMIDYAIAVPDEATARTVACAVEAAGFDPSISEDTVRGRWSVYCAKSMLATHAGVVAAQSTLNKIAGPLGGTCDGWASFGN
jgi:phage gp37-like protein